MHATPTPSEVTHEWLTLAEMGSKYFGLKLMFIAFDAGKFGEGGQEQGVGMEKQMNLSIWVCF